MTAQTIQPPSAKEWDTFLQVVLEEPRRLDAYATEETSVQLEIEAGLVSALEPFYKSSFVESVAGTDLAETLEEAQLLGKGKLAQAILAKVFRLTPSQFSQATQNTNQIKLFDIAFEVPGSHNPRALAEEFTKLSDSEFSQAIENIDFGHYLLVLQKHGSGDLAEVLTNIAFKLKPAEFAQMLQSTDLTVLFNQLEDSSTKPDFQGELINKIIALDPNLFAQVAQSTNLSWLSYKVFLDRNIEIAGPILDNLLALEPEQLALATHRTDLEKLLLGSSEHGSNDTAKALLTKIANLEPALRGVATDHTDLEKLINLTSKLGLTKASRAFSSDLQSTPNGAQLARRDLSQAPDSKAQVRVFEIVQNASLGTGLGLDS